MEPADFKVFVPTKHAVGLVGWLLFTFLAAAVGLMSPADAWYQQLDKPTWTPPDWVFGPAWTTLYIFMALAAWLVWRQGGFKAQALPLGLYLLQWALNALWTPLFFGLHRPGLAFIEILLLWLAIVATLVAFWRVHLAAGVLFVPYLLWVTYAAFLNFAIWRMNM